MNLINIAFIGGLFMARIRLSVGRRGANRPDDVTTIQNLLNAHVPGMQHQTALEVNGRFDRTLIEAITRFQTQVMQMMSPDGRVDVGGRTLAALNRPVVPAQQFQYPTGPQELLADLAVPYIGAREARGNHMGEDPRMREIFQADRLWKDGDTDGYPWCAAFVSMCVQKLIQREPLLAHVTPPRTAGVRKFYRRWAPSQRCLIFAPDDTSRRPHKGDVVVYTFSHIGIVTGTMPGGVTTIEGNTNAAGSREGTSVLRKTRTKDKIRCFIRLPIPASYDLSNNVCRLLDG